MGGLTHGFVLENLNVVAGIDLDPACRYAFEINNNSKFLQRDIRELKGSELDQLLANSEVKVLAGCAPCQPFSTYAQRYDSDGREGRWGLLYDFARLVKSASIDIVTMENVPSVEKHVVFQDFVKTLKRAGYEVWHEVVDSSKYGVPQTRRRMVLLASRLGPIQLIPPTTSAPKTVQRAIGNLLPIKAGESDTKDRLHVSASLSNINLERIKASKPGGTWRDWPEDLVARCHKAPSGRTYSGVYGRMEWNRPAPTMTTQCFGFGNGRFGHPDQDRAISLREAAILQSFPRYYKFLPNDENISFSTLGRLIGNAVPVNLGRAIGRSIKLHIAQVQ